MPQYEVGHDEVAPEGEYPFRVVEAKEAESKKKPDGTGGNPMIELELQVDVPDKNGGIRIWDRLVFHKDSTWKVDDFRVATGETLVKGPGSFEAEDCIDRSGKLRLMIETYQGHDRNKVEKYIDPAEETEEKPPSAPKKVEPPSLSEEFGDDDIPMK